MAFKCIDYDGDSPITGFDTRRKNAALIGRGVYGYGAFGRFTKSGTTIKFKAGTVVFVAGYTVIFTADESIDAGSNKYIRMNLNFTGSDNIPSPSIMVTNSLTDTSTELPMYTFFDVSKSRFVDNIDFKSLDNTLMNLVNYYSGMHDDSIILKHPTGIKIYSGQVLLFDSIATGPDPNHRDMDRIRMMLEHSDSLLIRFKASARLTEFIEIPFVENTDICIPNVGPSSGTSLYMYEIAMYANKINLRIEGLLKWSWNGKATSEATIKDLNSESVTDLRIMEIRTGRRKFASGFEY